MNEQTNLGTAGIPDEAPCQDFFVPNQLVFAPPILLALGALLRLRERSVSIQQLVAGLPGGLTPPTVEENLHAAELVGIETRLLPVHKITDIPSPTLPCLLVLNPGSDAHPRACVLTGIDVANRTVQAIFPENDPSVSVCSLDEITGLYAGYAVFVSQGMQRDLRAESLRLDQHGHWFWGILKAFLPTYRDVALASLVVNLLTLASPLFIMNVYDRVVPNNAVYTLWVLVIGVLIAHSMDFVLRNLRGYFVDVAGRNADVRLGSQLIDRILHMRLDHKPASVGGIVNNLREFEHVREFFGSTTLVVLFDLPFLFLFVMIVGYIGGPMVALPLLALPLMLGFVWMVQIPFQRAVERQYRQSTQKNSLLVEIVGGLETVKSVLAQSHMKRRWEALVDASAGETVQSRRLASLANSGTLFITYLINAGVIVFGVYSIMDGRLTQGGLIACVILVGRSLSPLMQMAVMLTQLQKSRIALKALQEIMELPSEQSVSHDAVEAKGLRTDLALDKVVFHYPGSQKLALDDFSLHIRKGEKVGIIGSTGSGKTTLGRLLVGLYQPTEGNVTLGGVDIRQIDQADVRARIGFMPQDNYLFYGTVRENIAIGCPWQDIKSIVHASEVAGVAEFVNKHPLGYDMQVGERGLELSGGQRQMICLARTLIRNPEILVLDEPSSNLDVASEQRLLSRLGKAVTGKTLVIMTHRLSLLNLVERVILLDNGNVKADGPRDAIMNALRQGTLKMEGKDG